MLKIDDHISPYPGRKAPAFSSALFLSLSSIRSARPARIHALQRFLKIIPNSAVESERGANLEQRRHPGVQVQSLFLLLPQGPHDLRPLHPIPPLVQGLEAQSIVFAAAGLFLAHGPNFFRGMRDHSIAPEYPARGSGRSCSRDIAARFFA
jgi:hypothetical protein